MEVNKGILNEGSVRIALPEVGRMDVDHKINFIGGFEL
jgi:hypothetical protein